MPTACACLYGHMFVIKYLIAEQHYDPDNSRQGLAPLHHACQNGHMDVIQYLITEVGCDQHYQTRMVTCQYTMLVLVAIECSQVSYH